MNTAKLETIRNILTKAEDPAATPAEAEAFTELAAKLMAKYGIEEAMLAAARPETKGTPESRRIVCQAPYAMEKRGLIHVLCEAMGLRSIRMIGSGTKGTQLVYVYGFSGDLDRMEMLYTSLLLQQPAAMRAAEHTKPYWEDVKAWRRSFLSGYASGVGVIVRRAEREAKAEAEWAPANSTPGTPSVALVVANRKAEVDRAYKLAHPSSRSSSRNLSGSGTGAGRQAGLRANIGGRSVGGGNKAVGR